MKMHSVKSSNIEAIGHDADSKTLHVRFKSGGLYAYHGVTTEQFAQLQSAESIGKHIHAHIKPKHPAKLVATYSAS